MTTKIFLLLVGVVILLSACLRLYHLGDVPHGMTWDEAAIGYNGFAVLNTRRDEWLHRLPVSFRSFGDYKAPLAIYINGLFTFMFGMTLWAVRLPFALAGTAGVAGFMLLIMKLWRRDKHRQFVALVGGSLLALSPWHLHFSRVGFESGMALTLIIWGAWCACVAFTTKKTTHAFMALLMATILTTASLYAYHSSKVVVPLLVLFSAVIFWKKIWLKKAVVVSNVFIGFALLWPLIKDSVYGQGFERAGVTIFARGQSVSEMATALFNNTITHLSPSFLIFGATPTLRHGDGRWGVLFVTTLLLVVCGVMGPVIITKFKTAAPSIKLWVVGLLWTAIGFLPAIITPEVPHSNRAFLALPGILILALLGGQYALELLKNIHANAARAAFGTLAIIHLFLFISYQQSYYTAFASESADDFKDGYLEALEYAREYEKGLNGRPQVEKILFTADYGQPYIYALFVRQTNPIWYQGGSLVTFEFTDKITIGDLERPNALIVASDADEVPLEAADHVVYGSDGKVKFKLYVTVDTE